MPFQGKAQRHEKGQTSEDQQGVWSAEAPHLYKQMDWKEEQKEAHKEP